MPPNASSGVKPRCIHRMLVRCEAWAGVDLETPVAVSSIAWLSYAAGATITVCYFPAHAQYKAKHIPSCRLKLLCPWFGLAIIPSEDLAALDGDDSSDIAASVPTCPYFHGSIFFRPSSHRAILLWRLFRLLFGPQCKSPQGRLGQSSVLYLEWKMP